jgi:hypothetical protein
MIMQDQVIRNKVAADLCCCRFAQLGAEIQDRDIRTGGYKPPRRPVSRSPVASR